MGKAGKALREVLEAYGISQNRVAIALGTGNSTVHYWVNESRDPAAEAVLEIWAALHTLNPNAAERFIQLYLGDAKPEPLPLPAQVAERSPSYSPPLTPAQLRQRIGLTQFQLAIELGKTPSTIAKWEAGTTVPTGKPSDIKRLCEVYQCTLDELITAFEQVQIR